MVVMCVRRGSMCSSRDIGRLEEWLVGEDLIAQDQSKAIKKTRV